MLSPSQNLKNLLVRELLRIPDPLHSLSILPHLTPQLAPLPGLAAGRATQLSPVPQQLKPSRRPVAGQGRKEAGPGSLSDKPRRPRTEEPEIGPYPVPTQPLRGLLVQSRVHAQATAFRSWCLRRCRRRHPAAVTTRRRRPGHPSGGAGRGRGQWRSQRRSQRARGKRTCSSPARFQTCL